MRQKKKKKKLLGRTLKLWVQAYRINLARPHDRCRLTIGSRQADIPAASPSQVNMLTNMQNRKQIAIHFRQHDDPISDSFYCSHYPFPSERKRNSCIVRKMNIIDHQFVSNVLFSVNCFACCTCISASSKMNCLNSYCSVTLRCFPALVKALHMQSRSRSNNNWLASFMVQIDLKNKGE